MNTRANITVVAGVVRRHDGRVLISRRRASTHLGGFWEFPGGKVAPEESLEEALIRELQEEVGVRAAVGALLLDTIHAYPDRTVHLHFFECTILHGQPTCLEVEAVEWCSLEELRDYPMPAANAPLIRLLEAKR